MDKVSIVIVFYNDIKTTEECLKSLLKTDYEDFEIILVDNHSTDGSGDYFKKNYPEARVVRNKVNGYVTGGYNFGAKHAKGEWLFFTNNDVVVEKDWLKNLIFDKNTICQPKMMDYYDREKVQNSGGRYFYPGTGRGDTRELKGNKETDYCQAEMFINKKLFKKLGGFDKRFLTNYEDVDLSLRAKRAGAKTMASGKSIIYHMGSWTYKKNSQGDFITYHSHKNAILTIKNNFFGVDKISRLAVMWLIEVIYCGILVLTGNFKKAKIVIRCLRESL